MTIRPKYVSIANNIEQAILLHKYQRKLPPIAELAKTFNTSKVTIVKSLKFLQYKSIVKPIRGHGTIILAEKERDISKKDNANEHVGFTERLKNTKLLSNKIISFDIREPTSKEAVILKLEKGDLVYDIIRQRLLSDFPVRLEYTIMPTKIIPGITTKVLKKSIYGYIEKILKLKIGKANRTFRADKSDAYDQLYLKCDISDPVLEIEQICFLDNGISFEYSQTRNRYDQGEVTLSQV
ncbi:MULTISPECIES: GntR family transcriptional regulator [unclassified Lactobacillus]|uniref:GntR family transcriptional regulator n=1 Tax=unclassified Lactobacillus TaxID=2620435 RepID=UPI000EFA8B9E|nr:MULTISPECIES: GntR family transcriptional regulator [unclassified Lactobacillus]RMC24914.1 GntR family transcriptional regulator [Lactobacillus sp. ESL0247]RMC29069.1 GntR family transcriptional regulator [Lactobacillus sp. ESL0246]RMC32672.1 GntR family transcriptional regulator [Lactobacillus sp. ESL0245]